MILLDTSFIVSYYNIRDENHDKAIELMKEIESGKYGDICITDYIFDECITVILVRIKNLEKTVEIGSLLRKSTTVLRVENDIFEDSWDIFRSQKNTTLSFTDCTTLALMVKENIKNIATFDEDFSKIKKLNVI